MNFLTKWFGKSSAITVAVYEKPNIECSSLILLSGPAYNDITFLGSFLVDAIALKGWAINHSEKVWSSDRSKQEARNYLPIWLEQTTYDKCSYVTLLDLQMRLLIVPYTLHFYRKGWCLIYCHDCKQTHDSMIENNHGHEKIGRTSSWVDEWLCPEGHIIHHRKSEVRWLKGVQN